MSTWITGTSVTPCCGEVKAMCVDCRVSCWLSEMACWNLQLSTAVRASRWSSITTSELLGPR
jgi:hypothetical protein